MKTRTLLLALALTASVTSRIALGQAHVATPASAVPAHGATHAPAAHAPGSKEPGDHGATHEGGVDHDHPAPINWTEGLGWPFVGNKPDQTPFVALVLNAALLFGLYYWKGRKPIAIGLKNRRAEIAKEIEEAGRLKAAAEERAKVYQAKLGKLEEELVTAREALLKAGQAERDRAVADAKEKAERMRRDAEFMVQQEMKQLLIDIHREAASAAVLGAEELLRKRLTPADHERLADEYLSDLSKLSAVAGGSA